MGTGAGPGTRVFPYRHGSTSRLWHTQSDSDSELLLSHTVGVTVTQSRYLSVGCGSRLTIR
eukprot:3530830-Rhodomonas_salina.1